MVQTGCVGDSRLVPGRVFTVDLCHAAGRGGGGGGDGPSREQILVWLKERTFDGLPVVAHSGVDGEVPQSVGRVRYIDYDDDDPAGVVRAYVEIMARDPFRDFNLFPLVLAGPVSIQFGAHRTPDGGGGGADPWARAVSWVCVPWPRYASADS